MGSNAHQYTIRNVPDNVDQILRRKARETGKSFNQVAVEALTVGAGERTRPKRDLREVVGTLSEREAAKMDDEIRRQRQVDPELWK